MSETAETRPRVPVRLVLYSVAGLWICYFIVATLRSGVMGLEFSLEMISRRLVVVVLSMVVTAGLWPMLLLLARRPIWVQAAAVCLVALPGSLLLAAINQAAFADVGDREETTRIDAGGVSIRKNGSDIFIDIAPKSPRPEEPPEPPARPASRASATPSTPALPTGKSEAAAPGVSIHKTYDGHKNPWEEIVELAFGRYFVLLAWAAIYLALAKAEQARGAERREGEFRRAAQAAELRSLRYQINPHFLFNTLNSLSALVLTGRQEAAERMIQTLSAFYRRSLVGDPTGDVPLGEEIALQKLYLDIEAVRFPERLRTKFDVPEGLADVLVPGMILQPLVENAVKYAVAVSRKPVMIAVTAEAGAGMLVLEVCDDGPGAKPAEGFGIGLTNVRDRILARFGAEASFTAGPMEDGGYRAVIRLPLRRRKD